MVPPVYGLSVRAALLTCVCPVCGKIEKGKVWCPAGLPPTSRSGSAASHALWSGSALCLVRGGDKRWVKIRKSKFMGDKTSVLSQQATGHVGDHDPCVQNPASASFSVSYLHDFLGICLILPLSALLFRLSRKVLACKIISLKFNHFFLLLILSFTSISSMRAISCIVVVKLVHGGGLLKLVGDFVFLFLLLAKLII